MYTHIPINIPKSAPKLNFVLLKKLQAYASFEYFIFLYCLCALTVRERIAVTHVVCLLHADQLPHIPHI